MAAIVVEAIVFASIAPQFLSVPNLVNMALGIAITGILAVWMTMVVLTGGIDLSVVALAGVVAAMPAAAGGSGGVALGRCGGSGAVVRRAERS